MLACRKSTLADNRGTWVKRHVLNFDVPIGAYNIAQLADLIGIFIPDLLDRIVNFDEIDL